MKQLLFLSGTHGDEYEVIPAIETCLERYRQKLPKYQFIAKVTPSAVEQKTRVNIDGVDLNRVFYADSKIAEVQQNIAKLRSQYFDYVFDFHEDPYLETFYLYKNFHWDEKPWENFTKALKTIGVGLHSGVDDPEDPVLNNYVYEGLCECEKDATNSGTLFDYLLEQKITEKIINFEIPGKQSLTKKEEIVNLIFKHLIVALL